MNQWQYATRLGRYLFKLIFSSFFCEYDDDDDDYDENTGKVMSV